MIKVFGQAPSRAQRVIWMLEEMGLPYEAHPVDFETRFDDAAFMAANPAGTIPAFVDGEVCIGDSTAAIVYLAARYGPTPLAPGPTEPNFATYLQFLHFSEASLGGLLGAALASRYFAPEEERGNWGGRFVLDLAIRRSVLIERQLEIAPFVAGSAFTAADVAVGYTLVLWDLLDATDRLPPAIRAYKARLEARPAYQRALLA